MKMKTAEEIRLATEVLVKESMGLFPDDHDHDQRRAAIAQGTQLRQLEASTAILAKLEQLVELLTPKAEVPSPEQIRKAGEEISKKIAEWFDKHGFTPGDPGPLKERQPPRHSMRTVENDMVYRTSGKQAEEAWADPLRVAVPLGPDHVFVRDDLGPGDPDVGAGVVKPILNTGMIPEDLQAKYPYSRPLDAGDWPCLGARFLEASGPLREKFTDAAGDAGEELHNPSSLMTITDPADNAFPDVSTDPDRPTAKVETEE